jgi:acetyl-CoA carboxylase carboxyltransferase component
MGPCAGSAVYSTAITDFVFMVRRTGRMFITGPEVVKTVTGERVTSEELGSVDIHAAISGSCHFVAESDIECLNAIRRLLSFLPSSNRDEPPQGVGTIEPGLPDEALATIVPADPGCGYDIRHVIARLVDNADYFEIQSAFAPNLVTAFARMGGKVVGIVAQQPSYMAGVIDCNASDKGARFVRFCDAFNISIVTLVDTPGYMPGKKEEQKGIIRHGAKLLYAYAEATVPKVSVVLRKAYGGAYIVMSSKGLGGDINYAWPSAEIAVMGPESAVNILYKKELNIADNQPQYRRQLIDEFRRQISDPGAAKSKGHLDEVILPGDTRRKLISALKSLESRQAVQLVRKHGNIPL